MNTEIVRTNPVRHIAIADIKPQLLLLVSWAYKFMNFKTTKEDLDFVVSNLAHCVKTDFANMTLKEVSEAFQNGVKLKYGDFVGGLSTSNFVFFLTKYNEHKQMIAKQAKVYVPKPTIEPTNEEKQAIIEKSIAACYDNYKRTGSIVDFGNVVCKELIKQGKIAFNPARFNQICEYVQVRLDAELNTRLNKTSLISEVRSIKSEIKDLNMGNKQKDVEAEAYNELLKQHYATAHP